MAGKKIRNFFGKKPLKLLEITLNFFLTFWEGFLILNAGFDPQIAQMNADFLTE
jgi:hypothetical protein